MTTDAMLTVDLERVEALRTAERCSLCGEPMIGLRGRISEGKIPGAPITEVCGSCLIRYAEQKAQERQAQDAAMVEGTP